MEVGLVQIATDEDFQKLWDLVGDDKSWKLEYQYDNINVWSKHSNNTNLKMVKVKGYYLDTSPETLFDVLMDSQYRPVWDEHMLESVDIGYLNPNNDVGYYAMSTPPPIQNRDYVLQRSWLAAPQKISIFNHSVYHKDYPPKKYFVRGISYLTGYVIEPISGLNKGCVLTYVSLSDPRGIIPTWAINKGMQFFAPRMMKTLHKACEGYGEWKAHHQPGYKPWIYPEQINLPKISVEQCMPSLEEKESWTTNESSLLPFKFK